MGTPSNSMAVIRPTGISNEDALKYLKRKPRVTALAKKKVKEHNMITAKSYHQLTMKSSTGRSDFGGTFESKTDFKSVLQRYFKECFAELVKYSGYKSIDTAIRLDLGILSWHRTDVRGDIKQYHSDSPQDCNEIDAKIDTLLDYKDVFLASCLTKPAESFCLKMNSIQNFMTHLEDRGHESHPFVDGLTVDLLPFQKQSLQWALDHERVPGGIQSYLWARLPKLRSGYTGNLYYSPIVGKFKKEEPRVVRGGIIAEMMGCKLFCEIFYLFSCLNPLTGVSLFTSQWEKPSFRWP